MIKKFHIETVNIEAIQFEDNAESFVEIRHWVGKRFHYDYQESPFVFLESHNFNDIWPVVMGDWIVKTKAGHFEVYKQIHMEPFKEVV